MTCDGRWDFFPPPVHDPCRLRPLWNAISDTLGAVGERQVPLPELYARLQRPPFGVRLGVLPILVITYLLAHRREVALYQEGAFCEALTIDQAELLCRRPALFALERFELAGLRGELFERYLASIIGNVRADATLLDIVRPLVRFAASLPEYTQYCACLSPEAERVRTAFRQAKSPGTLLFESLPRACGINPEAFAANEPSIVEQCIQRLIKVLRELKAAYPALLSHWQGELERVLLDTPAADLTGLREAVAARYQGLDRYTPDHSPVGVFIRRLADRGFPTDQAWLESVLTLLSNVPPPKWRDSTRRQAELRLGELGGQLRELERLMQFIPDGNDGKDALLVKLVDAQEGEICRVIRLSTQQRQAAADHAMKIAEGLKMLDDPARLAVVAELLKRLTENQVIGEKGYD